MASPNMLLCSLAIVLLGMATTLVSRSEGQEEAPELDPVGEEFPSQGHLDHTDMLNFDPVSRTMRGSGGINNPLEECRTDLIQCRQNLADFHDKILIDAMYDTNEAHDKVKSCKKELQTCHDNLADCKVVKNPLEECRTDLIQCRQNLADVHDKILTDAMFDTNEAHDKVKSCEKELQTCHDLNPLEECRTDLIQCRQNLADFHDKILIDGMYDTNEAHDKVKSCKKELQTCHDNLADCKVVKNPLEECRTDLIQCRQNLADVHDKILTDAMFDTNEAHDKVKSCEKELQTCHDLNPLEECRTDLIQCRQNLADVHDKILIDGMYDTNEAHDNPLEECRTDLIQCRQNLADFHDKMLIDAMYDTNEAHDKVKSCKKELQTCHDNLADCKVVYDKPVNSEDSMESPCKLEQMFFRRFAKHFINLLISEADVGEDSPLVAEVRVELGSYRWNKLRQFVRQKGKVKLVDAHDFMVDMLTSVRHDNVTEKPGLLERMTGMDPRDITFYALLLILGVVVIIYESNTQASWWKQLCAVMMLMFFISVCWNWVYLYKKELAVRISTMHKGQDMPPECMPDKMTWLDSIKEALRKQLTFKKDPCDVYHENVLVDPIYEVPPTRAIVHTLSTMFLEPLTTLGKQVSNFHRELFQDLPYTAWPFALLTVYLSLAAVCILMWYCPQLARRKDRGAWERVRELEAQLRERDAVNHRQGRLEEFEPRREDQVAPPPPMPALNLIINNRPAEDILAGQPQHQMRPEEPLAVERPPARPRRRPHVSSESDAVQDHPQRQPLNLGSRSADSAPYQGDVSGDDDSSDEADGRQGQRPRAPDEKYGTRRTEIQGQPVECPNSELDSMEERSTVKPKPKVQGLSGTKPRQKVRVDKMASKGDSHPDGGRLGKKGTAGGAGPKAKIRMEKPKPGEVPAENMSASVTPASSTDSEPFSASVPGLDSPSSVSVIEGDSTPASGGSVDGDSHLRSLGTSLSGSIDIIEPLGATGGAEGEKNEEGNDSDEFEVLSREQCQDEPMK